jgi:ABC-type multidrug transport system fused ATPase/permease subunit
MALGVGQAMVMVPDASKAMRAARALFAIIDRASPIDSSSPLGSTPDSITGDIQFKNIKFRYPTRPEAPVFNGMNLHIKAGQVVALVGQSGCGKSSTVGLLERFYDPLEGEVLVDGKNIKEYNVKWWRKQVGLVGQEPVLFSGTIAGNAK